METELAKGKVDSLLIVESPTKVATIEKYLPSNYQVIASRGHIRSIESKQNAVKFEEGKFHFKWTDDEDKQRKILAMSKKAKHIILATDPDREGEAISYHILSVLREHNINTPYQRITFNEITKNAILNALNSPRNIDDNLVNAYLTRVGLDYLIGFSISPVLWRALRMFGNKQSAGRVQSAALRLIAERELERRKFNSHTYFSIDAVFKYSNTELIWNLYKTPIEYNKIDELSEVQANNIYESITNKEFIVQSVTKNTRSIAPSAPYITSTLQQEASVKLNLHVSEVMDMAQQLYEKGLITYHRSDSTYMSDEAVKQIREYVQKNHEEYLPKTPNIYDKKSKNAQEAHECIRPTNVNMKQASNVSDIAQKLYIMIRNRAIESQMVSAKQETITYIANNQQAEFIYRESHIIFPSFNVLYEIQKDNRLFIPENTILQLQQLNKNAHETKPQKRYTEATLIKALEKRGIGRPSTFARIFDTLKKRDYVEYKARSLNITLKGLFTSIFLQVGFTKYVDYDFTSQLENTLDDIVHGGDYTSILQTMLLQLQEQVQNILGQLYDEQNLMNEMAKIFGLTKCKKCEGDLVLQRKFHFYSLCTNCGDEINLQIDQQQLTENIQIINTGKYRYLQLGETRVYLPNCVTTEITEEQASALSQLPYKITYNDKVYTIGKTFNNFYIEHNKKYFNFKDINMLKDAMSLSAEHKGIRNFIENN